MKFMNFDAVVRNAFNNDESDFVAFQQLLKDASHGEVEGYSKKEVNDKIVSIFRKAIGCDENSTAKEIRRAIRRNQSVVFDLLEEIIEDMLVSGWQNDPFMMKYVFYTEDDSMLSVMRISGNHHDIFLTISVRTK